ncbi:MAG: bifunctional UDP-N-acetylglucosamine diphosphorylase/glucosamine-1-phosphate N-acetyltransferase GlmU [Desulfuromonadaceae bacterium]|nr:bifunctional UDP-N-acetylglucosamine diphosphorylase/glucosamine-1-phosphate N-acetyltransferase GlmU [Desulfuromonadaceae bacterium]
MENHPLATVILAAGKGTRMKSERPKVLHPLAGRPLVAYPLQLARELGSEKNVLVIGHGAEQVREQFTRDDVVFAIQKQQLGTGHAVQIAATQLSGFQGTILLLCGDVPLLRRQTLEQLLADHRKARATVTVLTAIVGDATGYGRIVRDNGTIARIVEHKDATPEQRAINEINTGIYALEAPRCFELLAQLDNHNAQGEYYLTDIITLARGQGEPVATASLENIEESMGINDRLQLAEAARILRTRINRAHMLAGVTLEDPLTTYIDIDVVIGADSCLQPGVHLRGTTRIGRHCRIETGAVLLDCEVGDHCHIKAGSALEESTLGEKVTVGPMAHLRPGTQLAGHNKIGNFVETKKAVIGLRSQASHLSYIGDAELGCDINIGCGTITCNYDGVNKHKTVIEDGVFVGSDTQFVAPVTIGRNSLIGAGSTITKDVPADALALARTPQKVIEGWCKNRKKK